MHSFLITGENQELKKEKIEEIISQEKIKTKIPFTLEKIEDARNLKKLIKFSFNEKTAFIINDIDIATEETLNAFLKNLEEPNNNIFYILTASNLNNIIATIISRCEIIKINNRKQVIVNREELNQFAKSNIKQQISIVEKIKERGDAINFINDLIIIEKENNKYSNMGSFLTTLKNLKNNGNVSLQLTNLVVKMKSYA